MLCACAVQHTCWQEAQLSEGCSTGASLQGEATLHHCQTALSSAAGPEPALKLAAAPALLQNAQNKSPMQDAEPDPEAVAAQAPAPQAWQHQLLQHRALLQQLQPLPAGGSSPAPQHTVQKELSHALLGVLNPLESVLWQQRQHQRNLLDRALHALTSLQTDVDMLLVAAKSGHQQQQQQQHLSHQQHHKPLLRQSGFVQGTDMAQLVPADGAAGSPAQPSAAGDWSIAAAWGPGEAPRASSGSTALLPARQACLTAAGEHRKQPEDPAQPQELGTGLQAQWPQQEQQQWMVGCDSAPGLAAEFEAELLHAEAAAPGRRLSEETLKQYTTLVWHSSIDDADNNNVSTPPAAATPDSRGKQQGSPCSQQQEAVGGRETFPSQAVMSPPEAAQEHASASNASNSGLAGLASTAPDVLQQAGGAASGDNAGLECMDSFEEQLLALEAAAPGRRPAVSAEASVCGAHGSGSEYPTDQQEASSGAGLQDTGASSDAGCSNGKASSSPAVQGDSLTGAAALAATDDGDPQQQQQQQQQLPDDDGPDPLVLVSAGDGNSSTSQPDCKSPHKHVVFALSQPGADAEASGAACELDPAAGSTAIDNNGSRSTQLQTDAVAAGCSSSCNAAGPSSIASSASGTPAGLVCSIGASGDGSMGTASAGVQQLPAALGPTGDFVRPDSVGGLTNVGSSSSIGCFGSFHGTPIAAAAAAATVGTEAAVPAAAAVAVIAGPPGVAVEAAEGGSDVGVCDSSDDFFFEFMLRAQEAAAREAAGYAAGRSTDSRTGLQEEERWWSQDCGNTASCAAGCPGSSESSSGQPGGCQMQASPAPAVPLQASKANAVPVAAAAASVPDAAAVADCAHQLARPTAAAAGAAGNAVTKAVPSLKAAVPGTLSSPSASSIRSSAASEAGKGFNERDGRLLVTLNLGQPGSIGATLGLPLSPDSATATGLQEFTLAAAAQGCSSTEAEHTAAAAEHAAVLPENGAVQPSVVPSVQESMPQVSAGQASMVPLGQNSQAAAAAAAAAAGQAWHAADPGSLQQLPATEATAQDVQLQQELTLHDTSSWQECSFAALTAPAAAATPTAAQGVKQQQSGQESCQQGLLSEAGRAGAGVDKGVSSHGCTTGSKNSGPQTQSVCQYDGSQSVVEPSKQLGQQEADLAAVPARLGSLCSINCSCSTSSGVSSSSSSTAAAAQDHPPAAAAAAAGSDPDALSPGQSAGQMGGGCTVPGLGGHWGRQAVAPTLGQPADPQRGAPPLHHTAHAVAGCLTPATALPYPAATAAGPSPQPPAAAAVCSIGRPASAPGGVSEGAAGSVSISTAAPWQQLSSGLQSSPAQYQHLWQSHANADSNPDGSTTHQLQQPHQCPHTTAPGWPALQTPQPDARTGAGAVGSSSPQRQLRHVQSLPATPSQPAVGAAAAAATSFYSCHTAAAGQDTACHGSDSVGCSCCQPGWSTAAAAGASRAGHRVAGKCSPAKRGPPAGAMGAADSMAPNSMLHCAVGAANSSCANSSCANSSCNNSSRAACHTSAGPAASAAQTVAQQELQVGVALKQCGSQQTAVLPGKSARGTSRSHNTCSGMPMGGCRRQQCSLCCGCAELRHTGLGASAAGCADSGSFWQAAPPAHATGGSDDAIVSGNDCPHSPHEPQGIEVLNCSRSGCMANLHTQKTPPLRCVEAYHDLLHLQHGFADADISSGNHSCGLDAAADERPVQNCDRRRQYGSQQLHQYDHDQGQQQQQWHLEQQLAALDQRVQQLHRVAAASTCADRDLQHTLTQQLRQWRTVQQEAEEQEYQAACGTALQQAVISPRRQQRHKHKDRHRNSTVLQPGGEAWIQQLSQAAVLSPAGPAHCATCRPFACSCATASSCHAISSIPVNSTSAVSTYGRAWQGRQDGSARSRLPRPYSASAVLAAPAAGQDGFRPQVVCAATAASRRAGSALGYSSATAHRAGSSWLLQVAVQECCQEQLEQAVMAAEAAALAAEAQVVAAAITCTRQLLGG